MSRRILILTLAVPGIALAQQAAPPVSALPVPQDAAPAPVYDRLALLVVPERNIDADIDKLAGAMLENMVAKDPDFADAAAKYPGLDQAVIGAMRPLLIETSRAAMPLYRADLARLYARKITVEEAGQFADFLEKPATKRFFDMVRAQNSYKAVANNLADEQEATADAAKRDISNAAQKALTTITQAEKEDIGMFFMSPLGLKLRSFAPEKTELDLKWFNYSPPEMDNRIEKAVITAMVDHIAKTDPKVAQGMRKILGSKLSK